MSLTPQQSQMANLIMSIAKQRGLPPQAGIIAVMTALTESSLTNLTGAPTDHDSGGLFQQRPSAGWGTYQQVRDPVYATNKFFDHLQQVDWQHMAPWQAAQAVQGSAYSDGSNYQNNYQQSYDLVASDYHDAKPYSGSYVDTGGSVGTPSESPADIKSNLMAGLGTLAGIFNSIPELKQLLVKAIAKGENSQNVLADLYKTNWWKGNSDTARAAIEQQIADPATWANNLRNKQSSVSTLANQMGVQLNAAQLGQLAHDAIVNGWDDTNLQKQIAGHFNRGNVAGMGGQAAQIFAQLKQAAGEYGQQWSDQTTAFRTQQILGQGATVEDYTSELKKNAKAMYPSLAGQIDNGLTIKDIANPYVSAKANILEMDPATINWATDPDVKKALQGTNTPNGQNTGMSPMSSFEQSLRANPKWQYTANARDAASTALLKLGQDFGFAS